ncbi:MAG TPA: DUF402 domain-containing protein [Actinoplanes sp.]|nr:DUF402 domain-containing protein [Actinoplanes sp.]
MPEVELALTKYDGSPHRAVHNRLLGTDEFGTWLGTRRGTEVRFSYGRRRTSLTTTDAVRLIPHDAWWMAMFLQAPDPTEVYCDIITPAVRTPTRITVIDLDLDVVRHRPDGRVDIEDEPEFAENSLRYAYPADVITSATTAAARLQDALSKRDEPFGSRSHRWMATLAGL